MKYDRLQETFRYITPGLYFGSLILIVNIDSISGNELLKDTISKFSAIIVVLLPFVGFVFGYFIECIMSLVERFFYWVHIPRPSCVVLNGKCSLYILNEDARAAITRNSTVNNKSANHHQQLAKQAVADKEKVSTWYYQSVMARNILGAQLLATIYYLAFAGGWSWCHLVYALLILAVVGFFWYHQTCVYMKYLFAEYGKKLIP